MKLRIKTTCDVNGNPRRLLLDIGEDAEGPILYALTEEDYGTSTPADCVTIYVEPREYKRIMACARSRRTP